MGRHLSPIIARGLVARALHDAGVFGEDVSAERISRVLRSLEDGLRTFVDGAARETAMNELRALDGSTQQSAPRLRTYQSAVSSERDVQTARQAAREMCADLGGSSLVAQRVSTTVSELARNLLLYAPGAGTIEIIPLTSPKAGVLVRAVDRGPGIPALSDILAGRYQSKTGLGRGILGVKRLSDRFEIVSGSGGTRVESETWL
jgi:serine/threonine-protein kinase RsbT